METMLDTRNAELDLRTRMIQLPALRGLFLICTFNKQIFIRDPDIRDPWQTNVYRIEALCTTQIQFQYKIQNFSGPHIHHPGACNHLCTREHGHDRASRRREQGPEMAIQRRKLSPMGTWKKLPVPCPLNFDAICFSGKIYVPVTGSPHQKHGVLVHDMMTDKCRLVETWNQQDIRVVPKKCGQSNVHVEEMYCFKGDELDPNVEVFMYEVESDSWRAQGKVPRRAMPWRYQYSIELLNKDCFKPAPERGINVIWVNPECKSLLWFNSSVGKARVEINYNPAMEGWRCLYWLKFIRGSMYGMFSDEVEGGILSLSRRTIMKGRVIVASKSVAWEEVHEVGFFQRWTSSHCFTVMA